VSAVRRALQKALAEEQAANGVTQAEVARRIGVHRSVINRELHGYRDITLGRVAEIATALGRVAEISLLAPTAAPGENVRPGIELESTSSSKGRKDVFKDDGKPVTITSRAA